MRVSRLSTTMHANLSAHLASEFCSATLTFKDGRKLRIVTLSGWRRDCVAAFEHGVEEACEFNPSKVVGIDVEPFDLDLMAVSEARDLGIVLSTSDVRKLSRKGGTPGAEAAE